MRRPLGRGKQQLRGIAVLVLTVLAVSLLPSLPAPHAAAAPGPSASGPQSPAQAPARSQNASLAVTLTKGAPSVSPTGTLLLTVAVTLQAPVDTLNVRVRVKRPSGKLIYQKTEERYEVERGTTQVKFSRPLADLELKEGRYPIEVRVAADRLPPLTLNDRLYVVRPGRRPVPVTIVARLDYTPMVDADGRFASDPATDTRARDDVQALSSLVGRSPWLTMSLGFPPLMLEEWRRMASGYELAGASPPVKVPKDSPLAQTYGAALASLQRAGAGGRLEILDVPFADPDLGGLRSIGSIGDLKRHYDRSFSAYQASLGTTPTSGTAVAGDSLPDSALSILAAERIDRVLLRPEALVVAKTATAPPGVYDLPSATTRGLVLDERAAALLSSRRASSTDELLDYLFSRMTSTKGDTPVVVSVNVGGSGMSVSVLETRLLELARSGWVRFETTAEAAGGKSQGRGRLKATAYPGRPAPFGYWAAANQARRYAQALLEAVSDRDDEAAKALYDALVAESRCWAGADSSWREAERGRAFADSALRTSRQVLDRVTVATETITLSGATGKVPLSVRNDSDKTLDVYVVAWAANTRFPAGKRIRTTLRPADNYVTVPVDLGAGGVFDRVHLSVVSGKVTLAETTVDVRASYLDRLALTATVIVALLALLFYIRRKVRPVSADT